MKKICFHVLFLMGTYLYPETTRPVLDNIGYVWQPEQINQLVQYLNKKQPCLVNPKENPIAGICPHDDYLFSGDVVFPVLSQIKANEIVIFGVTHGTARQLLNNPEKVIILDQFDTWTGPFGPVKVSSLRAVIKEKLESSMWIESNEAHQNEHSIEAMLPFLQYFNKNIRILPIMVTIMDESDMLKLTQSLAEIITGYMKEKNLKAGKDVFFLFSCDANHYGPDFKNTVYGQGEEGHQKGILVDKKIAESYLAGDVSISKMRGFLTDEDLCKTKWCGRYSVPFGLMTTLEVVKNLEEKGLSGQILKYSDSYSHGTLPLKGSGFGITAPFSRDHWVGHLSVIYE